MALFVPWTSLLVGTLLLLVSAGVGWFVGRYRALLPVRAVDAWIRHIVRPMLESRSWLRRAVTIFLNNATVLAVVVALGYGSLTGVAGVAALGINMGIAVRLLRFQAGLLPTPRADGTRRARRRIIVGTALNMLEPPAIVLTLGLAVGQRTASLAPAVVWTTFGLWILPALLVAAGGEALWLGAGPSPRLRPSERVVPADTPSPLPPDRLAD